MRQALEMRYGQRNANTKKNNMANRRLYPGISSMQEVGVKLPAEAA